MSKKVMILSVTFNLSRVYQLQSVVVGPSQNWVTFSPNNKNMSDLSKVFEGVDILVLLEDITVPTPVFCELYHSTNRLAYY